MEDSGVEVTKRQRLDPLTGVSTLRTGPLPQHSGSPASEAIHGYSAQQPTLAPPNAYAEPVPPSPYQPIPEAARALAEHPGSAGFAHGLPHSGYSTPVREAHAPLPDRAPVFSRNGHHHHPPQLRDPNELPHPGAIRPHSSNFDAEGHVYPPASAQDPADAGAPPYVAHEPTTNGLYAHGLPMATHHDPVQQPPPGNVVQYAEAPGGAVGHAPQGGPPYSAGPYPPHSPWNRQPMPPRKPARALQACETCRQRKAKCDEGKPICGYCRENRHPCHYKEVQPAKADRAQRETMDQLRSMEGRMTGVQNDITGIHRDMANLTNTMHQVRDSFLEMMQAQHRPRRAPDERGTAISASPVQQFHAPPTAGGAAAGASTHAGHRAPSPMGSPRAQVQEANFFHGNEDHTTCELIAGSLHVEHSTGAHNLFRWSAIRNLLEGRLLNENFVMQHEMSKGLLRLYGRGQGIDTWDGASSAGPGSPASTHSEESTTAGRTARGSTPPDAWGTSIGRPNHLLEGTKFVADKVDHPGGLNPDGTLKLDKETMARLELSYLENMHILHPFLEKTRLRRMIERVHTRASQSTTAVGGAGNTGALSRSPRLLHNPAGLTGAARNNPLKRKLSNEEAAQELGPPGSGGPAAVGGAIRFVGEAQPLERRVSTAIVLLVLALGRICEHTEALPGPVSETPRERATAAPVSAGLANPSRSPDYSSSAMSPATASSPVAMVEGRAGSLSYRGSGSEGSAGPGKRAGDRNVDRIPGLAYFAKAVEILGGLQGNDLPHVQANLLAALYTSQMACVLESWTWIQHACRACHFLVRDPTFKGIRPARRELIQFAYWTCHQLEGDILAELDLWPSGIAQVGEGPPQKAAGANANKDQNQNSEPSISYPPIQRKPPLQPLSDADQLVRLYYSNQIYLRNSLNQYQSLLYPSQLYEGDARFSFVKRAACDDTLATWRARLGPELAWSDAAPPPGDINRARLRAKYYGAKYIIHRPFLYLALEYYGDLGFERADVREPVRERFRAFERDRDRFELVSSLNEFEGTAFVHERAFQVLMSCRICIDAAMRSTEAFDGIWPGRRLVVTNIFGTAHAQFGNVLVLAAVLESRLHWLVERAEVLRLLRRTIAFLRSLSPISSTLSTDASVLESVLRKIEAGAGGPSAGAGAAGLVNPNASFSSQ